MRRQKSRAKSLPKKVISDDDNLSPYCEPVRMYNTLYVRSLYNPSFLRRSLSYNIGDKGKAKSTVNRRILFNYICCDNNTLQTTEFRETCSCPFCSMQCGSFKVLELHLKSSHDLFGYGFTLLKSYLRVDIYVNAGALRYKDEGKSEPYSFWTKAFKRRPRCGGNNNSVDHHHHPNDINNDNNNSVDHHDDDHHHPCDSYNKNDDDHMDVDVDNDNNNIEDK